MFVLCVQEEKKMLEVILHCTNGPDCLSSLPTWRMGTRVPGWTQIDKDDVDWYMEKEDVLDYAFALGWRLLESDGKGVYVCSACIEGVWHEQR